MSKTLYLHPNIRVYRKKIFEMLASECGVDFAFTGKPKFESHISKEIDQIQDEFQGDFIQCNEFNLSIRNLSWFVLSLPFRRKYKKIIFSGCLYFPFVLMALPLKLVGKKIYVFDELWRYPREVKKFGIMAPIVKFIVKYAVDGVIAAGSKAKQFYVDYFDFPEDKISVAYNTTVSEIKVNDETKAAVEKRVRGACKNDQAPNILYLGRLVEYKGIDVLIKSLPKVEGDFNLFIVGDGDFRSVAERLVSELGLNDKVIFLGACLSSESPYYYGAVDGFVLPTKFLYDKPVQIESWGFTINEAMAMGKPVLSTTAVGSAFDLVVENKTGFIAEAGNVDDLAVKMNEFIVSIKSKTFKSEAIVEHLHNTCNYESNLKAYKSMLSNK